MSASRRIPALALPITGVVLAVGLTTMLALSPGFRFGGALSPFGLWVAGFAGLALLVAGASLPSERSGTSPTRRSLSVAGIVAAIAAVTTGIASLAVLGDPGRGGIVGPAPNIGPTPAPEPGHFEAYPAFVVLTLDGAVSVAVKTEEGGCVVDPAGLAPTVISANAEARPGEPVGIELAVALDGRIDRLQVQVSTKTDEFLFISGKGWDAAPPWIEPDGAPTQRIGSARLSGLVDAGQLSDPGGAPAREVSGTISWECRA